ncbi:MAG: 50S ribosomal protein L19 [Planctomycetes bacterium]|nr:50S ribosomal protein L19 [Planctomycetota bacterium]
MAVKDLMSVVEKSQVKAGRGNFRVGDTVDVHLKIIEGEKERIQVFTGIVIGRKGTGVNESFTVRRLVGNEGVERVFPLHGPTIDRIEVKKSGKIRRAKLYFLRDRVGKATRLAVKRGLGDVLKKEEAPAEAAVKPRQATSKPAEEKAEAKEAKKEEKAAEKK